MVFDYQQRPMVYCGEDAKLRHKNALVTKMTGEDHVLAQFDDVSLGAPAYGWHRFQVTEFKPREDDTAEQN